MEEKQPGYTDLLKENELLKLELERLKPYYEKHIAHLKKAELSKYGIDEAFAERITADTEEGIAEQVHRLAVDLRVEQRPRYVDPAIKGNGAVLRSIPKKPEDVGRKTYERLKESGLIPDTPGGSYGNNARYAKKVTVIKAESSLADFPKEKKLGIVNRVRKLFGRR
jgi:hypothetical protein